MAHNDPNATLEVICPLLTSLICLLICSWMATEQTKPLSPLHINFILYTLISYSTKELSKTFYLNKYTDVLRKVKGAKSKRNKTWRHI